MRVATFKRCLIAGVVAQTFLLAASPASAQDVVMRRPLPRDVRPSTGGETPPVVEPEDDGPPTPVVDPVAVCDSSPGSPKPVLVSANWIPSRPADTDSGTPNCKTRTYAYHCEAYYTCVASGDNVVSGGVVDDQVCRENAPPILMPNT